MLKLLKDYKDEISSGAALLGVVIGAVGFGITIFSLSDAKSALRASNAYSIQKDARQIVETVALDKVMLKGLSGSELSSTEEVHFRQSLWKLFNFYLSVFRQQAAGGLAEDFVEQYAADFCSFKGRSTVSLQWSEMLKSGMIGPSHEEMREAWCNA